MKTVKKQSKSAMKREGNAIARNTRREKQQHKYLLAKEKAEARRIRSGGVDVALELEAVERELKSLTAMFKTNRLQKRYRKSAKREIEELKAKRKALIAKYKRQLQQVKKKKVLSPIIPVIILVAVIAALFMLTM